MLRVAMRGLSVISQLILVRYLTPADFGLVAASSAAYAILDGLTETSMTLVVVQMPAPERYHYDTAWTLVTIRGLLVGAVLWFGAPLMADYLRDPRVLDIVRVLAIVPVVQGMESVGMMRLQRDLRFSRIFFYQLFNKGVGFLVAIPLVFIYRNYWALVLGGVAARLVAIPLSYMLAPYRPNLTLRGFGVMFDFSKLLLITNVLTMADNFLMPMLLGRVGTLREVGLYQVSRDFAALPASEIAAPIRGPMYAGYARVADVPAVLAQQFLTGLGVLVMVIVPISAGIAVTAPFIVSVVLGANWDGAAAVLVLAAVYTLFDAIGHASGGIYMVRHAQRPYASIMAGCLLLRIALVVPATIMGGLTAAMAMMAATAIFNAFLWFSRLRPLIGVTWSDITGPTWRSFAAAAIMVSVVLAAELAWPRYEGSVATLVQWMSLCLLGAEVHIGTQYFLWLHQRKPIGPETRLLEKTIPLIARLRLAVGL